MRLYISSAYTRWRQGMLATIRTPREACYFFIVLIQSHTELQVKQRKQV